MGRLIPLLLLVEIALVAVALISCLSAEEDQVRNLPRPAWVFLIVFLPLVGAIMWFSAGRPLAPVGGRAGGASGVGSGYGSGLFGAIPQRARNRRLIAPDDDPEFLRSLDIEQARRDSELFRRWEDDLLRDDDGRHPEPGGTGGTGGTAGAGGAGPDETP